MLKRVGMSDGRTDAFRAAQLGAESTPPPCLPSQGILNLQRTSLVLIAKEMLATSDLSPADRQALTAALALTGDA